LIPLILLISLRILLAVAHIKSGDYSEALRLLDDVLSVLLRVTGPQNLRVASVLNDIGVAQMHIGDLQLASRSDAYR